MTTVQFPIYIVSIPRARARLDKILAGASGLGLDLRPIEGVDGKEIPKEQWTCFDKRGYALHNGRHALPGEYGCYASHLKALTIFLESDAPIAVVVEDDVTFPADFRERVDAILGVMPKNSIVKLTSHRRRGFRGRVTSALGDTLGRCVYGPQGSSACYIISRAAAERFLKTAGVMTLPYDRALECGWGYGTKVYVSDKDVLPFGDPDTLVGTRDDYRGSKFVQFKRVPAYLSRFYDNIARYVYAFV
ncbi:glycosyltransferase family 25 protein [Agrobacterium tumefaciens]|uniref:glycosyltransferase family 25 protein n=1 Tax=Agrobacterium tumefaciens TaxID=358 RepID=UPI00287CAC6D|nr:glycosyltransferase family 25 protein [Agrobacterium tumefaciens]MDS7597278.1 glycosyltransferase family 25 protein [Agrobacterium tumefaciens]